MIIQNLLIYDFDELFKILDEVKKELNTTVISVSKHELNDISKIYGKNYILITKKNLPKFNNQFILNDFPVQIFKLMEKVNIEFLKLQFNKQSQVKVNNYDINLNSREMIINDTKLKLTEKEINTISYLAKSKKPVSINELQAEVWSYQSDIETHTVETHIYRLRKKILNSFNDNEFIISKKNGSQIK